MAKLLASPVDRYVGASVRMRRMLVGVSRERLGERLPVAFFFEGADRRHGLWRLLRRSLHAYLSNFLATTDGVQLAKAFLRIKSSGVRRRLIEALADDGVA